MAVTNESRREMPFSEEKINMIEREGFGEFMRKRWGWNS